MKKTKNEIDIEELMRYLEEDIDWDYYVQLSKQLFPENPEK